MLESGAMQLIIALIGAFVIGLVAYVMKLANDHKALELKVSEQYVKQDHLGEIKHEIHSLRDLVYRIAVKMEVPTFTEPYK